MNRTKAITIILLLTTALSGVFAQSTVPGRDRGQRTLSYKLVIDTNLRSAVITVKGPESSRGVFRSFKGNDEYTSRGRLEEMLVPGTYHISIDAPGYFPEEREIELERDRIIHFDLKPLTAEVTIEIPRGLYIKNPQARGVLRFYDNDMLLRGGPVWQLTPGRHILRIETGAFSIEGSFDFEPGRKYVIEPFLGLRITE